MFKYVATLLLLHGCISDSVQQPVSHTYEGTITLFLQNDLKLTGKLSIIYADSSGTFTASNKILFDDSIRIIRIEGTLFRGYLFAEDLCFDRAFDTPDSLTPVSFTITDDTLKGKIPATRNGFRYEFISCRK